MLTAIKFSYAWKLFGFWEMRYNRHVLPIGLRAASAKRTLFPCWSTTARARSAGIAAASYAGSRKVGGPPISALTARDNHEPQFSKKQSPRIPIASSKPRFRRRWRDGNDAL